MPSRNRLTDQAIANIVAAESAQLEKVSGGWRVNLSSNRGDVSLSDKLDRPVVYESKDAARRAIGRHNSSIEPTIKAQL